MIILEFNQVEVDYCTSCEGTWLDQGELELMLDMKSEPLDLSGIVKSQKSARRCPRCRKKMQKGLFPQTEVEVDMCPRDGGLWLDKGELVLIAESRSSASAVKKVADFFGGLFKDKSLFKED